MLAPRLLALFETVASHRNGMAVVEARDGRCSSCQVRLRPQLFNNIRLNDSLIQCESCQRILYFEMRPDAPARGADGVSGGPVVAYIDGGARGQSRSGRLRRPHRGRRRLAAARS